MTEELLRALTAQPVKPGKKQLLGAAIGAVLFPRGGHAFLASPMQWAQTQAALRESQTRNALESLLKIAALNVEQVKATAPVEAAKLREEGATTRHRQQIELEQRRLEEVDKPRAEAERQRTEAERQRTEAQTAETLQRTALSPAERYTRLVERYAEYLGSERYTPQGDEAFRRALAMLAEQIGAQAPPATLPPQPSPAQQQALAQSELAKERAATERELREPRKQQLQARTALIKAETLLAAARAEEVKANMAALRQRVAQGWANVRLRAQTLVLAQQRANDKLLTALVRNASMTVQNIDKQIAELRKAKAQLQYPISAGGVAMPAYDPQEMDAMIRELQQQREANKGVIELGSIALQRLRQRLGGDK